MATGSTEAAFTSNQSLPCFNSSLLKSDSKYWNGAQVLATTSEDSFWEDDPEEKIKKKVLACKSVFHMGRCLQIKHLPRDVTETVSLIHITVGYIARFTIIACLLWFQLFYNLFSSLCFIVR